MDRETEGTEGVKVEAMTGNEKLLAKIENTILKGAILHDAFQVWMVSEWKQAFRESHFEIGRREIDAHGD